MYANREMGYGVREREKGGEEREIFFLDLTREKKISLSWAIMTSAAGT